MKKDLKQYEVVELAQMKYGENPLVSPLLVTLMEARAIASQNDVAGYSTAMLEVLRKPSEAGRSIPLSNSDLVTSAAKMASALDLYARTVLNLACVLQALGEDFSY